MMELKSGDGVCVKMVVTNKSILAYDINNNECHVSRDMKFANDEMTYSTMYQNIIAPKKLKLQDGEIYEINIVVN